MNKQRVKYLYSLLEFSSINKQKRVGDKSTLLILSSQHLKMNMKLFNFYKMRNLK